MQIITDIEQGSDEWLDLRRGVVTGSNFAKVMAKGQGKTRRSYMLKLAAEIVTGNVQETYKNSAMEWGNECEPQARAMYEFSNNCDVEQVAFIKRDDDVGVSPDGLVGDAGMLEIKCPETTTQIEYFLSGKLPAAYKAQVQGQMWVAQREWCDFVAFDPRINGDASYMQVRVERDEKYIDDLIADVEVFVMDLKELVNKLKG